MNSISLVDMGLLRFSSSAVTNCFVQGMCTLLFCSCIDKMFEMYCSFPKTWSVLVVSYSFMECLKYINHSYCKVFNF